MTMVEYGTRGAVAVLTVKNPPVNALSQGVRQGLIEGLDAAGADDAVTSVLLICDGRTFIAGADIKEFKTGLEGPSLDEVLNRLDASTKPVVAAIHGTAFGGGLEVALACHYRVATPSALCGLPEVKLGLLPGAGGTQRLPRVIPVEAALDLIVGGDPMPAPRANELGLVDELVEGDLLEGALAFAGKVADVRPLPRVRDREEHLEAARRDPSFFDAVKTRLETKARGAEAPFRCLAAVRAAVELPFEDGLARERELFFESFLSPQAAALQYVFFAERTAAKIPDLPRDTQTIPVERVGVIGAGTMGGGISMAFLNAGFDVTLVDRAEADLERGVGTIRKNYASSAKRGRLSEEQVTERLERLTPTTRFEDLAEADLVIEAVFEEMELKREIFKRLDGVAKDGAILASNTSTLDVNRIAAETARPEQVLGLHFFSPANVMRLLEIVRGEKTSAPVLATALELAKRIKKVGVVVGVCDGFVGNRMLHQYTREASYLIEEGALPEQVDRVITGFGFPMGPFQMGDLAGLDIGWRLRKAKGRPASGRYGGDIPDKLCELGRFGQKTGSGYYRYEGRTPVPDPEVTRIIEETSRELGIERRAIDDREILERCLLPMVNEAAKILEEGIAIRASDIDTIWVNGYGFPPHRGGPMWWADREGLSEMLDRIRVYAEEHGPKWTPAPLLVRLVEEGKTFTGR